MEGHIHSDTAESARAACAGVDEHKYVLSGLSAVRTDAGHVACGQSKRHREGLARRGPCFGGTRTRVCRGCIVQYTSETAVVMGIGRSSRLQRPLTTAVADDVLYGDSEASLCVHVHNDLEVQ